MKKDIEQQQEQLSKINIQKKEITDTERSKQPSPQWQNKNELKQALVRKIRQRDEEKINKLTIMQIYDIIQRQTSRPPVARNDLQYKRMFHETIGITEQSLNPYQPTPGDLIDQRSKQIQKQFKAIRFEEKIYPVWSYVRRGKLGIDNVFLLFGLFGSILLPIFFYYKFKDERERIVKSRIVPPKVIQLLDDDSPIQPYDVSIHMIRRQQFQLTKEQLLRKQFFQKKARLQKQLDQL